VEHALFVAGNYTEGGAAAAAAGPAASAASRGGGQQKRKEGSRGVAARAGASKRAKAGVM